MADRITQLVRAVEALETVLADPELARRDAEAVLRGEWLAAAGVLAGGVAGDLATPLAEIQAQLRAAVEQMDGHMASARGPKPLPWADVVELRRSLADAFLLLGRVARLAADLTGVVAPPTAPETTGDPIDVNEIVERAVVLSRGRLTGACEIMLDLGAVPAVRGEPARLTQAMTQLLFGAAFGGGDDAWIAVRTLLDAESGEAVIELEHPPPAPGTPTPFAKLVEHNVAALGGTLTRGPRGGRAVVTIRLPAG